jgi:xanthine dehydrogenase YagR molybdenum-binding subunit
MSSAIGSPLDRADGPDKVTGAARYTAEVVLPTVAYAALVGATIASGRVVAIKAEGAVAAGGVVAILTHENLPTVAAQPHLLPSLVGGPAPGMSFFPMQDDVVHYFGQPVAIVVAESYEGAQHAASLVEVEYELAPSITTIDEGRDAAYEPERLFGGLMPARNERGDVDAALEQAAVRVDVAYHMAANHHNPMEAATSTAVWDDDHLTIYDSAMGVRSVQLTAASLLGIPLSNIRVVARFVGGSFGSKAMVWPTPTLAAMAARHVRRPVKLAVTRPQMFTSNGQREEQEQQLTLGATRAGDLLAIRHEKLSLTSPFDDWAEPATGVSSQLYSCENFQGVHRLIRGNTMTPTFTRGPGESLGSFVLETAMDELAQEIGIDPVELRVRDHASAHSVGHTWWNHGLEKCLR